MGTMEIDKICRVCLRKDDIMVDMTEKEIYHKFLLFANVTAEEDIRDISPNLCQSCEQKLNISWDFKEECQKSHEILSNYVKNTFEIKYEVQSEATHADISEVDSEADAKKPPQVEQFSQSRVSEEIKYLKQKFYENKNCIQCSFVGNDSRVLAQHMSRMHKNLKSRWCYACNAKFDNLTNHLATNHSDDFICKFCSRKFQKLGHLIDHLRSHSDVKFFRCSFCDKCFIRQSYLNVHVRQHTKEKPYKCSLCNISFTHLYQLKKHLTLHESGGGANKQQATSKLKKHMQVHTSKGPRNCRYCEKKFKTNNDLIRHEHSHTGKKSHNKNYKDLQPFQCSYCYRFFRHNSALKDHMFIHSGKKPYKCNQCSYASYHSSNLPRHMKTHVFDKPRADRPHVCLMCNRTFTTNAMLTSHIHTHNVGFLEI